MAKKPEKDTEEDQEPFENQPSDLDEMTHAELRLMYDKASDAVLFAKRIQWLTVGGAVFVYQPVTLSQCQRVREQFVAWRFSKLRRVGTILRAGRRTTFESSCWLLCRLAVGKRRQGRHIARCR